MGQPTRNLLPIASLCGIYIWEYQGMTISYDPDYQAMDINEEPVSEEEAIEFLKTVDLTIPIEESYIRVLDLITQGKD